MVGRVIQQLEKQIQVNIRQFLNNFRQLSLSFRVFVCLFLIPVFKRTIFTSNNQNIPCFLKASKQGNHSLNWNYSPNNECKRYWRKTLFTPRSHESHPPYNYSGISVLSFWIILFIIFDTDEQNWTQWLILCCTMFYDRSIMIFLVWRSYPFLTLFFFSVEPSEN